MPQLKDAGGPMQTRTATRRPSLRDVAQRAGVSAAAVSYVVNGRLTEVGAGTCTRIQEAIKALRYQPQRRGLSLRLNREFAIGLIIVDQNTNFLADPFTTEVATGLSNELTGPGYGLTVTGCRDIADLERLLGRPIGVDAFVIIASGSRNTRKRIYGLVAEQNRPVAILQEDIPSGIEDGCAIFQDDDGGAKALTRHLVEHGAKRFLFVKPACAWPAIERRERGIRSALSHGCVLRAIRCNELDFDETAEAIDQALRPGKLPDAVMGANDQIAIAALRVLSRRGIAVPEAMQVTGYNDFTFRNYVMPRLTTVASQANEIGRRAARLLLSRLDSGAFAERRVELAVTLDLCGTSGANG